jgi:methylase of polypeptide subunit release factors
MIKELGLDEHLIWRINGLDVHYDRSVDGGGSTFGREFIPYIKERYPDRVFDHALEWCAGPGFIGFGLLQTGLCNHIHLLEKHAPAVEMLNRSKSTAQDPEKVHIYHTNTPKNIPVGEKFDLVVGNPPWFKNKTLMKTMVNPLHFNEDNVRICVDQDWTAHAEFFKHIKNYLSTDGVILLSQCETGSPLREEEFRDMIEQAGLKIISVNNSNNHYNKNAPLQMYYIEITHAFNE